MGRCGRAPAVATRKTSAPRRSVAEVRGGTIAIVFGRTRCPSVASTIGTFVTASRACASLPVCEGGKCWSTTNASPVSAGIAATSWRNASSPPADAPTPTTRCGTAARLALALAMEHASTPTQGFSCAAVP